MQSENTYKIHTQTNKNINLLKVIKYVNSEDCCDGKIVRFRVLYDSYMEIH